MARSAFPLGFVLALVLGAALTWSALSGDPAGALPPDLQGVEELGDPGRGALLLEAYGCSACHVVPGVPSATGLVGPPLSHFAVRGFIAGRLANTPANLVLWIRNPQQVDPETAMPNLGVSEENARHIAAYLYTLD